MNFRNEAIAYENFQFFKRKERDRERPLRSIVRSLMMPLARVFAGKMRDQSGPLSFSFSNFIPQQNHRLSHSHFVFRLQIHFPQTANNTNKINFSTQQRNKILDIKENEIKYITKFKLHSSSYGTSLSRVKKKKKIKPMSFKNVVT
jgi:hypothetical protein